MRIKLYFDITDKPTTPERVPNNMVHSFLLNHLPPEVSERAHTKGKSCLFHYNSPKIHYEKDRLSFFFSGSEELARALILSLRTSPIARLGRYHMNLHDIRIIDDVDTSSGRVLLRGRVLMSHGDRSRPIRDREGAEKLLADVSENKLKELGINERLTFDVFKIDETTSYLCKKGKQETHLPASHIVTSVSGSPEALDALLMFGAGQNTGTGNGMMWEVS